MIHESREGQRKRRDVSSKEKGGKWGKEGEREEERNKNRRKLEVGRRRRREKGGLREKGG